MYKVKILHLNNSDLSGGAAKAMYRLHKGLIDSGLDSKIFVLEKTINDKNIIKYKKPEGIFNLVTYNIRRKSIAKDFGYYENKRRKDWELFTDDRTASGNSFINQIPDADIYHLHWISRFIDITSFFKWNKKPLVWTLHDMNPFTGGCHYDDNCGKFNQNCGQCPQLGSNIDNDLSRKIYVRKSQAYSQAQRNYIKIITDSYWLEEQAKTSSLFQNIDISTIHYGLDTEVYKPSDKISCRKALRIPLDKKIICFGAPGLDNKRKGFFYLREALNNLEKKHNNLFLLYFGSGNFALDLILQYLNTGFINNELMLSVIYNSADVFVIPSVQEAFGQTCLEAMACGIPAIGFNAGGIPDMIKDGITGYLAKEKDVADLSNALDKILSDDAKREEMGRNAREFVLKNFTLDIQAKKYINIYNSLINV